MGEILPPKLVLPLLAVSSRHEEAFDWSADKMRSRFGTLQPSSDRFPFDQTDYYRDAMGDGLQKQFLVPDQLFDPAELSRWKVETNQWEVEYAAAHHHAESRPLNLDPGYLTEDKLVLASTKNHAHRIYLDDGIYAEITLQFRSRKWQKCPWTYPDYQQACFHSYFDQARSHLRSVLRAGP